jgi:hypothetical protein
VSPDVPQSITFIDGGVLAGLAGTDFFTAEVLTPRGLVTYYVLFFIHLESRRVDIAGVTVHPDEPWMQQIARTSRLPGWPRHFPTHGPSRSGGSACTLQRRAVFSSPTPIADPQDSGNQTGLCGRTIIFWLVV